jgi:CHASE1-domain containing sensor protein
VTTALKAALLPALLLAAGCQVNVDNQSRANLENAADSLAGAADNAADAAGNVAESAAGTVENAADAIGNKVDVNVDLHGDGNRADGNSADANRR